MATKPATLGNDALVAQVAALQAQVAALESDVATLKANQFSLFGTRIYKLLVPQNIAINQSVVITTTTLAEGDSYFYTIRSRAVAQVNPGSERGWSYAFYRYAHRAVGGNVVTGGSGTLFSAAQQVSSGPSTTASGATLSFGYDTASTAITLKEYEIYRL